jgi:hypothetical protein
VKGGIRIHIKGKGGIMIHIQVKEGIRIGIKVMKTRNTPYHTEENKITAIGQKMFITKERCHHYQDYHKTFKKTENTNKNVFNCRRELVTGNIRQSQLF